MPIITSVTRPAESGTTNSGEFAINGLPIQIQATGNTVGNDLTFDGDGLSLSADSPAAGTVTGASVNGGPAQSNINPDGILQLTTPKGTVQGVVVNGVTAQVNPTTGIATVNIVTASGTVTSVVLNGVAHAPVNGVVTLQAGTVSGATINGGAVVPGVNGVLNLTKIGRANAVVFEGQEYSANDEGVITLPSASSVGLGATISGVAINGGQPVEPNEDGVVNLGNVGTVRQIQVNGVMGTTNETTGVASVILPVGGVASVSVDGGAPILPVSGNINLTGLGTVKTVTVNNSTVTPVDGNINLGSLGTLNGVTVNNIAATVVDGVAQVSIPVGTGTVTGIRLNGGSVQSPTAGVVSLSIPEPTDVVKRVNVGGQLLTPVNGTLTLTLPAASSGTVSSVSVNGGAPVSADVLGNVALQNVGTVTGVSVNGAAAVSAVNGVVSLTNLGTISGVTVNGGSVITPVNGKLALTNVGRVNRVIVNSVEANISGDGTATVNIPLETNSVKSVTINGGSQIFPVTGNVDITIPTGNTAVNAVTGITVNGGSKVTAVAGVAALTGVGTVTQIRHNGSVLTPSSGEIVLNTGTVSSITVNGGPALPVTNGNVDISVQAAQAGAQSITVNGGAPVGVSNGNIALQNIGTVTGATVNGGAVIAANQGRLNLTNIGTVTGVNIGGTLYTASNGVVTLPASSGSTTSGVQTISLNGGSPQSPADGNINLLVGTLSGVTVNGVQGSVVNGRATLSIALPEVPVKGVSVDGSTLTPNGQGVVNISLQGLAKTVTFLGETQNVSPGGALNLPSTVGTVKAVTINGGAQITPTNGVINLVLPSGQTSGIQSLVVNGQTVTANNGVATFSTPQGTVTGATLNGNAVPVVNGVIQITAATGSTGGVRSLTLNGSTVALNGAGNASITGVVTQVSVNGGAVLAPNESGLLNILTPTNFVKTISVNGGAAQAPDSVTGNYNITLPTATASGVQGVSINGGNPVYPTANGIVDLAFSAATNYVRSININGIQGSPDTNGLVNITIPAGNSIVQSVSINGGTKYSANTQNGNIDITAALGAGTVTGIQVNGGSVVTPNPTGTLILNGLGTVSGATINGGAVIQASSGRLNLTGIGTVTTIQANGQSYSPVGGSNTVNLGTLGTVNSVSINGGAPVASSGGNVALTGIGTVTGATVNGGSVVPAVNGVLNLTVAASGGPAGGVQAVSVNGGTPQYPQGGVVNLTVTAGQGTVTGVTVNGGTPVSAINGLVSLTGVGTVSGATINGGSLIQANNGVLALTGVGTLTGVTLNGGLVASSNNGVANLTYTPPNDTVKSVSVNGGAAQTPVNGVLNLTVPTGSGGSSVGNIKSVSVNGGLAISGDTNGLLQLNVGTVKGVRINGATSYPDPQTGLVDLGTIASASTGSTAPASPFPTNLAYTAGDNTLRLTLNNGTVYSTNIVASSTGSTGTTVTDEIYVFAQNMQVVQGKYYHDGTGIYRRLGATANVGAINAADTTNWLLAASVDQYLRSRAERISAQGVRTLHDTLAVALSGATSGDTVIQNAAVSDITIFGNAEQVRINAGSSFRSNGLDIGKPLLQVESAPAHTQGDCLTLIGGKGVLNGGGAHVYNNTSGSWAFGNYGQGNYKYDIIDYHIRTFAGEGFSLRGVGANVRFINGSFEMAEGGNNQNGIMLRDGAKMEINNGIIIGRGDNPVLYVSNNAVLTITDTKIFKHGNVRIKVDSGGTLIMRDCIISCQEVTNNTPVIEADVNSEVYLYNVQMETYIGAASIYTEPNSGMTSYVEAWGETYLNGSVSQWVDIVYYNAPGERVSEGVFAGAFIDFATRYQEGELAAEDGFSFVGYLNAKLGSRVRLTLHSFSQYDSVTGWLTFNSAYAGGWSTTYAVTQQDMNGGQYVVVNQTGFSFQPGVTNFIDIECVGVSPQMKFEVSILPGPVVYRGLGGPVNPGGGDTA